MGVWNNNYISVREMFSETASEARMPSCIRGELTEGRAQVQQPHDEPVVLCTRCEPRSGLPSCRVLASWYAPLQHRPRDGSFTWKAAALLGQVLPAPALPCLEEGVLEGHGCCTAGRTWAGPLHRHAVTGMLCACRTASAEVVHAATGLPGRGAVLVDAGVVSSWETWHLG